LLVLARPLGPMLWAFPARSRRAVARSAKLLAYLCGWDVLSRPLVATILHAVAIWAWHVPPAFEAALLHEPLHWLQHLSFLVTALFFWWAMFETRRQGAAVIDLFFTAMHTAFLGVLLTVAPRPMYPLQSALSAHFGLDPLADQQLAGLIMWVPAGTVYVGAGLALDQPVEPATGPAVFGRGPCPPRRLRPSHAHRSASRAGWRSGFPARWFCWRSPPGSASPIKP
jgi:cytochrome c oxidase assembly factor CtaG